MEDTFQTDNVQSGDAARAEDSRFELFMGLLGSAGKSIQRLKAAGMGPYSLSAAHTDCLCLLAGAMPEGMTQTQLAARLSMDRAQVSRVLRDLRERAYVLAGGDSGYKSRYRLTEAGRRVAGEADRVIREVISFVSGGIPRAEIDAFYRTFRTIVTRLGEAVPLYGASLAGAEKIEEDRP